MTLAELAALAAEYVPEFKRPCLDCDACNGMGWVENGDDCDECDEPGTGRTFDNLPATLLMAVFEYQLKGNRKLETDRGDILVRRGTDWSRAKTDGTPESIARAALVALLRAHGVEVPE